MTGQVTGLLLKSGPPRSIRLAGLYCVLALVSCAPRTIVQGDPPSRSVNPLDRKPNPVHHTTHIAPRRAGTVAHSAEASQVTTASKGRTPRPDQSLLEPQPPPDCEFKGILSKPMTAEETRMKLDYEQQCYRHSEMIVRMRLQQLQNTLEDATKATTVPKLKR